MNDIDGLLTSLYSGKLLTESQVKTLCEKGKEVFREEPNVVELSVPLTICGDIHGQFIDLLEIFQIAGRVPDTNFLFMGDYVDRGFCSIEVIALLVCLKIRYRHRITLLRGNHECRAVTITYGFYLECLKKYGNNTKVWSYFTDMFDYMPMTALVEGRIFCMHGGLSPHLESIDEIRVLVKHRESQLKGPMSDLLWSDPIEEVPGWSESVRGAGYHFGQDITKQFNQKNGIDYIARGHQVVMEGYTWSHSKSIVTVFSASKYCGMTNKGAILNLDENKNQSFIQYSNVAERQPQQSVAPVPVGVNLQPLTTAIKNIQ